jgi:hypothetical protein
MMLYIAATSMVVSATIIVEREEEGRMYKVQRPIYYISEVLSDFKSDTRMYKNYSTSSWSPPISYVTTLKATRSLW